MLGNQETITSTRKSALTQGNQAGNLGTGRLHSLRVVRTLKSTYALDCITVFAKTQYWKTFRDWIWHIFGQDIPLSSIKQLHEDLGNRQFQDARSYMQENFNNPPIYIDGNLERFQKNTTGPFGGFQILGAYSNESIYVNVELVEAARVDQSQTIVLLAVLVEEFGHHLDYTLRNIYSNIGGDAPLDEGAVFALQLHPIDNIGIKSYEFAYDYQDNPFTIEPIQISNRWTVLFPEKRIAEDRGGLSESGESVEFFAAADIEVSEHGIFRGHEGIEREAFHQLNWSGSNTEDRRKWIYFGNWQRDFSQLGDPKVYEAFKNVDNLAQTTRTLYLGLRQRISQQSGNSFINALFEHIDDFVASSGDDVHIRLNGSIVWIVDLLAEDKFGPRFHVTDNEGDIYRLGVYIPKEHIDNPSTITEDYQRLDPRFRRPYNVSTEGVVNTQPNNPRFGQLNYIQQSVDYVKDQLELSASEIRHIQGRGQHQIQPYELRRMLLGNALHTIEDYYAHSNFAEFVLKEYLKQNNQDHDIEIFAQAVNTSGLPAQNNERPILFDDERNIATSSEATNNSNVLIPIVTGIFGGLDTAMSLIGVLAHHLEQQEDNPVPGPSRVNRLLIILLRRHNPTLARIYSLYLDVDAFLQLPVWLKNQIIEGISNVIVFIRKQIVWSASEFLAELIIRQLEEKRMIPSGDVETILEALHERNLGHFIRRLGTALSITQDNIELAVSASTFVDINYQGDPVFTLRDPGELGHSLENLVSLYQKLKTDGTNTPTHTQLSKDHDTHPLHTLAVKIAIWADKKILEKMERIWHGHGNINEVKQIAEHLLSHPEKYPSEWKTQLNHILQRWVAENNSIIQALRQQKRLTPLSIQSMEGKKRLLINMKVALQRLIDYANSR